MLSKIVGKRPPQELSEEDVWEAFMGFNKDVSENKYDVLSDHIKKSNFEKPVQVYKPPETYFGYVSDKFHDACKYVTGFFW